MDKNGNRVDDAAERRAAQALLHGKPNQPVGVLIAYLRETTESDLETLTEEYGAARVHAYQNVPSVFAEIPAIQVFRLPRLEGLAAVEFDRPVELHLDTGAPATQGREGLLPPPGDFYNGITAEALGFRGQGMVVAIIDTGVDGAHEALSGKMVTGVDVNPTTNIATGCIDPADSDGHGTHVASTAVGDPPNALKGVAPKARYIDVRIFSIGGTTMATVNSAYDWLLNYNQDIESETTPCPGVSLDDRVDVVHMSAGQQDGQPNAGPTTEGLVADLVEAGVVVTNSAGNAGGPQEKIGTPANAAGNIAVGSSADTDTVNRADDHLSSFSSRGPDANTGASGADDLKDRHRRPDVVATGSFVRAAQSGTTSGYVSLSGTSMSGPMVAGVAALILQVGETVKAQTGGVNKLRPTGTGFNATDDFAPGKHPTREALIMGAEYATIDVGASNLATWEGPAVHGRTWNNGWGYGHVDTFSSICWAWNTILAPAGAAVAPLIKAGCLWEVDAGGPYEAKAGSTIPLRAYGPVKATAFDWDLDMDGDFDDASGPSAFVTAPASGTKTVAVRAEDLLGRVDSGKAEIQTYTTTRPTPSGWTQPNRDPAQTRVAVDSASMTAWPSEIQNLSAGGAVVGGLTTVGAAWGDLDQDGVNELVVSRAAADPAVLHEVTAYHIGPNEFEPLWTATLPPVPSDPTAFFGNGGSFVSEPVIVGGRSALRGSDVAVLYRYDPAPLTHESAQVALFSGVDGTRLALVPVGNVTSAAGLAVGNVDAEAGLELVLPTKEFDSAAGGPLPAFAVYKTRNGLMEPLSRIVCGAGDPQSDCGGQAAIADLDNDGWTEVVIAHSSAAAAGGPSFWVSIANATSGARILDVRLPAPASAVAIQDLDGDSVLEIVTAGVTPPNTLFVLDAAGGLAYSLQTSVDAGALLASPGLGNVMGDTRPEIVLVNGGGVGAENGRGDVAVYEYDGASLTQRARVERGGLTARSPDTGAPSSFARLDAKDRQSSGGVTLANLDSDAVLEIMFGSSDGTLSAWEVTGGLLKPFWNTTSQDFGTPLVTAPMLADLTGDGVGELVTAAAGGEIRILGRATWAPILAFVPDALINETEAFVYQLVAMDPDHDTITYSMTGAPTGSVLRPTGQFLWTPDYNQAGVHAITFAVADTYGSDSQLVRITVNNVNRAPTLTAVPLQDLFEGEAFKLTLPATDPDADPLAFTAVGLPGGAFLDSQGVFTWTPAYNQSGAYDVEFEVSDGTDSDSTTVTFDVGDVNRAPSLTPILDVTSPENAAISINVVASDREGDPLNYTVTGLPTGAAFATGYAWGGRIAWTPSFAQAGSYPVRVDVTDGVYTNTTSFRIVVTNIDRPPVFVGLTDQVVNEGATLRLAIVASDPDGDAMTITAKQVPPAATYTASGGLVWTPDYDDGTNFYSAEFEVASGGHTLTKKIFIKVVDANRPPTFLNPGDKTVKENELLTFTLKATDPDGAAIKYGGVFLPAGVAIDPVTGAFTWTPTYDQAGEHTLRLTASDKSNVIENRIKVTVVDVNRPPVAALPTQATAQEGSWLNLTLTGTDPDGDPITRTIAPMPSGATLNQATGAFSWLPAYTAAGTHAFTLTVSDGSLTDSRTWSVVVANTNRAPVLSTVNAQTLTVDAPLQLTLNGVDPDGDALTYTSTGLPAGIQVASGGTLAWTPTNAHVGSHEVTFRVSDGELSAQRTTILLVQAVPSSDPGSSQDSDAGSSSETGATDSSGPTSETEDPSSSQESGSETVVDEDEGTTPETDDSGTLETSQDTGDTDSVTDSKDDAGQALDEPEETPVARAKAPGTPVWLLWALVVGVVSLRRTVGRKS